MQDITQHPTYRATQRAYESIGIARRAIIDARATIDDAVRAASKRADDAADAYTIAYNSDRTSPEVAEYDAIGDRESDRVSDLNDLRNLLDAASMRAAHTEPALLNVLAWYANGERDPFGEG